MCVFDIDIIVFTSESLFKTVNLLLYHLLLSAFDNLIWKDIFAVNT